MDCGAGFALGQQLAKDALHMQGGVRPGTTGNVEQDALMTGMMVPPTGPMEDWAQHFAAHQHHHQQHQQMMMQRQHNDALMIQQQHRDMEEAFRASARAGAPQQANAGPLMMPPGPMMMAGGMAPMMHAGGFMMGGMPQMMPCAPMGMNMGMAPVATMSPATTNTVSGAREGATAVSSAAPGVVDLGGDSAWAEKLHQAEWGQDYKDVEVHTVEGSTAQTVEEHAKTSKFYEFMDKIRKKELLVDEDSGEVVQGPGPDPDVEADTEYLARLAAMEGINVPPSVMDHMQGQDGVQRGTDEDMEGMMGDDVYDPSADVEQWAQEYAQMQAMQERLQNNTDYPFEANNPYMYHENPMEEGLSMLKLANLAEAALAFEAVCQKEPEREEAWRSLGLTQAENEKDGLAIIALNHARMLDPKDIAVHAALAVSHTNEHNANAALASLRAWLLSQPQYEQLGSVNLQADVDIDDLNVQSEDFFFAAPNEYRECRTLLHAALEMNPNDAQLHASLGVLYNLSNNYDSAAANLRRAVELRPDDAQLWNKLGATLANGNRPQEALDAYNRALDINPGYVRVMYNMAVSYSNMSQYDLAAKQLVRAIYMQVGGTTPTGEASREATRSMWDFFRMLLNVMNRPDLVELTYAQNVEPFAKEFGLQSMLL
ncbi:peroxisome targeting signal 1 receptor, putative [Trypanosoma brucei gambiense DAL972]|uniref:Peroxisome targeting signal 1 receptor, putative n=3 Tax=Trypanosoma brucei TaxID=5691 RepID=C9ZNN6_TRYB9|nr:peroxisome targeting signal 1 receptor, putative [Trypanosoma brucei gambiense DAL972]AAD54220.1 peroxisome targeting signal 1 receptor PEX5 [Trypanosoma brucei]CBH11014.1 peroxisome targeting signal 1 receptor, putative [Trypanosoma brucei gambiense DAL972]|eukprot:XP_011773301.1 peroxisome targeting signal 1 receptor, putative [Trypanosoma brucei gambiense DAL972]